MMAKKKPLELRGIRAGIDTIAHLKQLSILIIKEMFQSFLGLN